MSCSERQQYLQQVLCSSQAVTSKPTYHDAFGLFLNDDETSEIEVFKSLDDSSHDEGDDDRSPTSSFTLTEQFDNAEGLRHVMSSSGKCQEFSLKKASEVNGILENDQRGLVMIHIKQVEHSRTAMRITRSCFEQLLQAARIFPALKDTILHIGVRNAEIEVAPPALRTSRLHSSHAASNNLRDHELSYGLRYMHYKGDNKSKPWAMRQFFVYNKTQFTDVRSIWVMFCLPPIVRAQTDEYLQVSQQRATSDPLAIHAILCLAVIKTWRPYFVHLTDQIEDHRYKVGSIDLSDENVIQEIGSNTLGALKNAELAILDALLALRATKDTCRRIQLVFRDAARLEDNDSPVPQKPRENLLDRVMSDQMEDLDLLVEQATTLLHKVQSLSTFHAHTLELSSGFSLQGLASQQAEEGKDMKQLTRMATRDTKAVKALSIITLIYLPITVVFNFFSTSFVNHGDGGMQIIGNWWLLFVISVPLTILTLFVWIACVLCSSNSIPSDTEKHGSQSAQ